MMRSDLPLLLLASLATLLGCGPALPVADVRAPTAARDRPRERAGARAVVTSLPGTSPTEAVLANEPCPAPGRLPCSMDPLCRPAYGATVKERECSLLVVGVYRGALLKNLESSCQLLRVAAVIEETVVNGRTAIRGRKLATPGLALAAEKYLDALAGQVDAARSLAVAIEAGDETSRGRARARVLEHLDGETAAQELFGTVCEP